MADGKQTGYYGIVIELPPNLTAINSYAASIYVGTEWRRTHVQINYTLAEDCHKNKCLLRCMHAHEMRIDWRRIWSGEMQTERERPCNYTNEHAIFLERGSRQVRSALNKG